MLRRGLHVGSGNFLLGVTLVFLFCVGDVLRDDYIKRELRFLFM